MKLVCPMTMNLQRYHERHPLFRLLNWVYPPKKNFINGVMCCEKDCAWWSKQGKCAILLLAEKSFNVSVAR